MPRPLYDKIAERNASLKARFCMPGHCGENDVDGLYASAQYDWTEVEGLDNLLQSDGVILQSERLLAQSYGYAHALMLTGGSTCAMQIAMLYAKERGGAVVAIGNMHKSFYSAARLFGLDIYCFADVRQAEECKELISCVFVTSPDYYGVVTPLKDIKEFAVRKGAALVVDEAHSAHFPYSHLLPDNAHKYADIAFASMHKTLPVYGGGAALFVNGGEAYETCRKLRAELHTTSPNYLVMASIDYAQDLMSRKGEEFYAKVKYSIEKFKMQSAVGRVLPTDDFSRLVIKIDGFDCDSVSRQLAAGGVFAEMAYGDKLVFIVTPFNCGKLAVLGEALKYVRLDKLGEYPDIDLHLSHNREIGKTVFVDFDSALGETSAMDIGFYPPGVPTIKKGDVLDAAAINFIKKYSTKLFGLACGKVGVLK